MEEEDFSKEMIKMEVVEWYSSRNDEALLLYEVYVAIGTAYWDDEEELKENPDYPSSFDRGLTSTSATAPEYLERYFLSEHKSIFVFGKEIDPSDVEWDDYDQARQINYGYFDLDDVEEAIKLAEEAIEDFKKSN